MKVSYFNISNTTAKYKDCSIHFQAGTWKYQIIGKHSEGSQRVAVSVISSAAKVGETPIIVTAYWYTRGLSLARGNTKRQILYVTVSRGNTNNILALKILADMYNSYKGPFGTKIHQAKIKRSNYYIVV